MADSSPLDSSTHYSSPAESESVKPNPCSGSIGGPVEIPFDIEKLVEIYKSALTRYQDSDPGKSYESVKPKAKPSIGGPVEVSIDITKKEEPARYQKIVKICKLAVTHYQDSHPGKSYEFESVHEAFIRPVAGFEYRLKFRAKNMMEDGNPIQAFKAVGYSRVGGVLEVVECLLLE